jgi:ankyrin repeat protein
MSSQDLHTRLILACENENIQDVQESLEAGADPNFNIKSPLNALLIAIQKDNHEIIKLLLEHNAIIKEFVLQKAIEKNKQYCELLIPDFSDCKNHTLLMGVLQASISRNDFELAKQAIEQGAEVSRLALHNLEDLENEKILELLLRNGFNIHTQKNILLTIWLGSSLIGEIGYGKRVKHNLLSLVCTYYLKNQTAIEKFKSWRELNKSYLFREGLNNNNLTMMQFALKIGAEKNSALNSALNRYYNKKTQDVKIAYEIIHYILNLDIQFTPVTLSNAVFFHHTDVLNAIRDKDDLEYGYEMAYTYDKEELCQYFIDKGVSSDAQSLAKMRVSAKKGDIKELRSAINSGADIDLLDRETLVEIIEKNQVAALKFLCEAGVVIDSSLNVYLNDAIARHKAYESVVYLIEQGLDITSIKNLPREFKKEYPALADMREKRFKNIFEYTIYLARDLHPTLEGKQKEEILKRVAQLCALPYVKKMSQEKLNEQQ